MAYGLKYSQYLEKGGATLQIRVYVDGWSGASYGMAHLTGASLQLIGGQANILAPYIKTSFSFSLADCWDEGATKADGTTCVNAQNEKCGRWEEFYTPDATKFRVELWAKVTPTATASCIWKGYVTPDSWSENMMYRGTVTITARDMLGALQDKEFDLTGRVSILDIVQGALSACQSPMGLSYTAGHFLVNEDGSSILSHTIAASTFAGGTWQTVLQDTLESLGLTLRYNGHDALVLTSLRYIAADTTSGSHTIEYINRSGLRELDPALKFITETFDVDVVELAVPDPAASQYAATGSNLTQKIVAHLSGGGTQTSTNYIPGYTLTESGGEGWSGTLAVPALGTIVDGAADRSIYFPTDIQETVAATLHLPRMRGYFAFKMEQDGGLMEIGTRTGVGTVIRPCTSGHSISEVRVRVEAVVSGTTKYLSADGTWGTTSTDFGIEIGQEVIVPDPGAVGIKIVVVKVITENTMPAYYSIIAALKVTVSPGAEGASIISEYKTTTRYDDANNVTITRRPAIGSASLDGCVDFFQNVLALGDAIAADRWNWPGASSYYPLAVMIQAQALCYYAAAASVFTGTAHDKAAELALPGCGYGYYDRACVAVSATYDFGSGFIVQTNLREYYTWESVWGTFSPDYSEASGSGRGSTSATGASGASINPGSGSGGTGGGGGVNYFQINGTLASLVELKDQYTYLGPRGGLFFSGATLSGTPTPDLYVDTVNNQRVLRSPLPLITGGDQIVIDGTPGGGGGGGSATLAGLDDVSLSGTPTQGQYLAVGSNGKWTNVPAPSGGGSVNSIVVGTTPYSPVDGVVTLPAYAPYNSAGYLPLSAGSTKALTDALYVSAGNVYNLYLNNSASGATNAGIRFQVGGTTIGELYTRTSDNQLIWNGGSNGAKVIYHTGNLTLSNGVITIGSNTITPVTDVTYDSTSDRIQVTKGGSASNVLVGFATTSKRFARYVGTNEAGGYDLNTLLTGGGITSQYGSSTYWANQPTGMTYGGVVQLNTQASDSLCMQFAWDVVHTSSTVGDTGKLWWRDKPTAGWGTWHLIYDSASLTKSVVTGLLGNEYHPYGGATDIPFVASTIGANGNITITGSDRSINMGVSGSEKQVMRLATSSYLLIGGGTYETLPTVLYGTPIRFYTYYNSAGGERMRILADGTLLIGATSLPSGITAKLYVNGATYLNGNATIPTGSTLTIGGATISWVASGNSGYLKINTALLTEGDQIVNSGTPGGGGGGTIPYLYELQDVTITNIGTGNLLQWNGSAWVNVAASSVGVTTVATTQALGLVKSTTTGTTANRTYNVEVNTDGTMKVNVPWENNTYSLLTSSANGLAPAFSTANKATSASTNSYYFLGWTGSTMKWYSLPANAFSDTTYSAATQSAAGLMSSTDKTKLDGIATGATAVTDSTVSGWGYLKTDEKVKQTATTTSAAYEILFSESANNTTTTEGARKTSTLTYNPSTKALSTGGAVNGLTLTAATTGFTIAGGSTTSKTLTVSNTYTLGDACAKGYTDSSSASAISTGTSLVTERDVYYGLPTINNAHNYTSSTTIYAPTGAGTSGYWLKAAGGTSAPTWEATSNLEAGKATTTADTTNALYVVGVTSGATSTLKRDTSVTITGGAVSATSLTLAGALSGATTGSFSSDVTVGGDLILSTNNKAIRLTDKPASGTGTTRTVLYLDASNNLALGYGTAHAGYPLYIDGNEIYLRYSSSHTKGITLNSSGNVTIGSSDLASTTYKLYVDGSPCFVGTTYSQSIVPDTNANDTSVTSGLRTLGSTSKYFYATCTKRIYMGEDTPYLVLYGANISRFSMYCGLTATEGNGTHGGVTGNFAEYFTMYNSTNRGWIFQLNNGSTRTNVASISGGGVFTTNGDQVVSSDATLKKDWRPLNYGISDIAKATAGVFTWKDGRGISAGTKAQDWEHLVPQLVHGEEGHKTLAYGQVAMLNTILLARGYESHEERIKRLEAENMELKKEIERLRMN